MGVIVKLVGPDRGRADWGRRALVGFFLLGGPSMAAVATEETPEAKVGWVEKEVAAAIEEFRRTDDPTVLEDRGDAAIMRGADNRVVRSPSARARLWNSAIALWLEAWQARPYKDVVRGDEKSEDLKEFFADSSPEGPEKWARREALRAKAIRDGQLRRVCGLIQSELGSQYGVLYGFDGGSHAKEFMGELERLWAGRPWFAVFSTNVVKDVELKFGSERPAGPAAGKEKGASLGSGPHAPGVLAEVARAEDAEVVRAGAGVRVKRGAEENARTASGQHGPTSVPTGAPFAKRAGDGVGLGTACVAWASSAVIGYLVGRGTGSGRGGRDE